MYIKFNYKIKKGLTSFFNTNNQVDPIYNRALNVTISLHIFYFYFVVSVRDSYLLD
jgi:hypothetical protein